MNYQLAIQTFNGLIDGIQATLQIHLNGQNIRPHMVDEHFEKCKVMLNSFYPNKSFEKYELISKQPHIMEFQAEKLIQLKAFVENTILTDLVIRDKMNSESDTNNQLKDALQTIDDLRAQVDGSRNRQTVFEKRYNDLVNSKNNTDTDSKVVELQTEIKNLDYQLHLDKIRFGEYEVLVKHLKDTIHQNNNIEPLEKEFQTLRKWFSFQLLIILTLLNTICLLIVTIYNYVAFGVTELGLIGVVIFYHWKKLPEYVTQIILLIFAVVATVLSIIYK